MSVHVPLGDMEESIATMKQFSPKADALYTYRKEAWPLIRTELTVKTHDGGQLILDYSTPMRLLTSSHKTL
jgi:hypothetical protein